MQLTPAAHVFSHLKHFDREFIRTAFKAYILHNPSAEHLPTLTHHNCLELPKPGKRSRSPETQTPAGTDALNQEVLKFQRSTIIYPTQQSFDVDKYRRLHKRLRGHEVHDRAFRLLEAMDGGRVLTGSGSAHAFLKKDYTMTWQYAIDKCSQKNMSPTARDAHAELRVYVRLIPCLLHKSLLYSRRKAVGTLNTYRHCWGARYEKWYTVYAKSMFCFFGVC